MGAVTAIMYGDRDPSIAGMVLDSGFSSLKLLIEELVKNRISLPAFVCNQAVKLVKSTVKKKANFNLDDIEPIKFAERCFIPAMFVHANGDDFVQPHHSKMLHDIYPGDKNLVYVDGDHNSSRPRFFRDSAAIFFYNTLQVQHIKEISDNYAGFQPEVKHEEVENKEESLNKGVSIESDNKITCPNLDEFELINEKMGFVDIVDHEEEIFNKILELSKKEHDMKQNEDVSKQEPENK